MKYESELSNYVESLNLTPEIKTLIRQANFDIYSGPLFLDKDGEACSLFNEGATQFDFSAACDKISAALGDVSDLWIDTFAGGWQESEPEPFHEGDEFFNVNWEDWYHMDRSEVLAYIVGKELVSYVS